MDLNQESADYESDALTVMLWALKMGLSLQRSHSDITVQGYMLAPEVGIEPTTN